MEIYSSIVETGYCTLHGRKKKSWLPYHKQKLFFWESIRLLCKSLNLSITSVSEENRLFKRVTCNGTICNIHFPFKIESWFDTLYLIRRCCQSNVLSDNSEGLVIISDDHVGICCKYYRLRKRK